MTMYIDIDTDIWLNHLKGGMKYHFELILSHSHKSAWIMLPIICEKVVCISLVDARLAHFPKHAEAFVFHCFLPLIPLCLHFMLFLLISAFFLRLALFFSHAISFSLKTVGGIWRWDLTISTILPLHGRLSPEELAFLWNWL